MILTTRRQRRVLAAMHSSLRDSDPRLVARFATFTLLTADDEIPRIERVMAWPLRWLRSGGQLIARHFNRPGLRPGEARHRLQGAVFIPLAALLLLVIALLAARSGARTRCVPPRAGGQRTAAAAAMRWPPGAPACPPGHVPAAGRLEPA